MATETGAELIFDTDPKQLMSRLVRAHKARSRKPRYRRKGKRG